jgi:hypothetical protein
MPVGFGFVGSFILPASPERLRWGFSAAEKQIALRRYREAFNIEGTGVRPAQILKALKDPKAGFYSMSFLACLAIAFGTNTDAKLPCTVVPTSA